MNSTSQIVPGYTGYDSIYFRSNDKSHIPSVAENSSNDFSVGTRSYIPGKIAD